MTEWGGFTRKGEGGKLELSAECRLLRYVTAAFRVILNNNSRVILLTNHGLLLLFWWRLWRTNRWRREQKFHNSSTMLRLNIELYFPINSISLVFSNSGAIQRRHMELWFLYYYLNNLIISCLYHLVLYWLYYYKFYNIWCRAFYSVIQGTELLNWKKYSMKTLEKG